MKIKGRWWKLSAYLEQHNSVPKEIPDQYAQYVKGSIADTIVVVLPEEMGMAERVAIVKGMREVAALSGLEQKFMFVPDSVKFMKLTPVDTALGSRLDDTMTVRKEASEIRASEATIAEEKKH